MFKFVVILSVAVWLGSLFFSRKRRVIRDINHLLTLIIGAALFFASSTALRGTMIYERMLYYVPVLLLMAAGSWGAAYLIVRRLKASSRR